jgi:methyl-accepting chemotaxis protein
MVPGNFRFSSSGVHPPLAKGAEMKLITRLVLLVSTTAVLFGSAIAVYFVVLSPIDTIQAEHRYFATAYESITDLQIQVGRLLTDPFGNQKPIYDAALKKYLAAVDDVGTKVVLLPLINKDLAEAVDSVKQLREISQVSLASLDTLWKDLENDAKAVFYDVSSAYILKFFGSQAKKADPELLGPAQFHVFDLQDAIQNLNAFLSATAQTIHDKDVVVGAEISKIRGQSMQLIIIVVGVIVVLALVLTVFMSRSIVKTIAGLVRDIGVMATGDLTFRFAMGRKDEIGQLGGDLNQVLEMFDASLRQIQAAAGSNQEIRQELISAVTAATSAAVEIEANSNSIRSQMERMDRMIDSSSGDMDRVGSVIASFNERMAVQNGNVEESAAAVTQMLASIDNIARITERNRGTTETLVKESDRGRSVFEDAFGKVTEIAESVNAIKEMATVIAGIASQTNILAMNAAIEAAHAGEFGKGFAVVADEIAKLAAASASSSEEIAQTIKTVVSRFNEAASTRDTTIAAFDLISSRIKEVTDSVDEIYRNAAEMRTGSRQVLEATQQLRSSSSEITGESGRINTDIDTVRHTFSEINRVSREVVSNISEISVGLHEITRTIHHVSGRTDQLMEVGTALDTAVSRFKTGGD